MASVQVASELRFERVAVHAGAVVHGAGLDESDPDVAAQHGCPDCAKICAAHAFVSLQSSHCRWDK